jgi:hypothetical protein
VGSECRIVVIGPKNGDDCLTELRHLPKDAVILGTGTTVSELQRDCPLFTEVFSHNKKLEFLKHLQANVLLNVSGTKDTLGPIIDEMPFLDWIHSTTAGIDHMVCPSLASHPDLVFTNAKGSIQYECYKIASRINIYFRDI